MREQAKGMSMIAALGVMLVTAPACNHSARRDQNASVTDQEAPKVETPSGGGTETTNKRSVPERPPAPQNTQMGSAVPPAAADQTRPHPQQAAQPGSQQSGPSSTPR